jgi:hypothetical protein
MAEVQGLLRGGMLNQSAMLKAMTLLQQLGKEDISAALAEAEVSPNVQHRQLMMMGILNRWSEFDGAAAMEYAEEHAQGPMSMGLIGAVAGNWANQDPDAVLAWYREMRESPPAGDMADQGRFVAHQVFQALGAKDPDRALEQLGLLADEQERQMAVSGIAAGAGFDPERRGLLLEKFGSLDDGKLRRQGREALVRDWATWEPEAAAEWLASTPGLADEEAEALRRSVRDGWMQNDPQEAAEWALESAGDDPEAKESALRDVIQGWAWRNPNAAAAWLGEQGDGPETDPARRSLAQAVVREDPESAFVWASTISNAEEREGAVRDVYFNWRNRDPDRAAEFLKASDIAADKVAEWIGQGPGDAAAVGSP